MAEIAEREKCSVHKVQWHLDKQGIRRRTRSEAGYVKHNPAGDPFALRTPKTLEEAKLLGLGIGLYWGEGTKASPTAVRLGNTDSALLRKFVKFLTDMCGVPTGRIKYGLQIFEDIDAATAVSYWMKELNITREQFLPTIVVSPAQGRGTYRRKSKYGVVTIYFNNKKLRDILVNMLQ
jgi:hypothetical protein